MYWGVFNYVLRMIECDVYVGLDVDSALKLGIRHNEVCETLRMTFQVLQLLPNDLIHTSCKIFKVKQWVKNVVAYCAL